MSAVPKNRKTSLVVESNVVMIQDIENGIERAQLCTLIIVQG